MRSYEDLRRSFIQAPTRRIFKILRRISTGPIPFKIFPQGPAQNYYLKKITACHQCQKSNALSFIRTRFKPSTFCGKKCSISNARICKVLSNNSSCLCQNCCYLAVGGFSVFQPQQPQSHLFKPTSAEGEMMRLALLPPLAWLMDGPQLDELGLPKSNAKVSNSLRTPV